MKATLNKTGHLHSKYAECWRPVKVSHTQQICKVTKKVFFQFRYTSTPMIYMIRRRQFVCLIKMQPTNSSQYNIAALNCLFI